MGDTNTSTEKLNILIAICDRELTNITNKGNTLKYEFAINYLNIVSNLNWRTMIANTYFDKCTTIDEVKRECDILLTTN